MPNNLCVMCGKPLSSRRKGMNGVAQNYCTNQCMLRHAEDLIRQDPSNMWSAPAGSDPNHGYKIPRYNPKVQPPPVGAGVWDYLAWATVEFVEQYRAKYGGQIPPNPSINNPYAGYQQQQQQQQAPPRRPPPQRNEKDVLLQQIGLAPSATLDEVEKHYKALARKYHPDANGTGDDTDMKKINGIVTRLRELMR